MIHQCVYADNGYLLSAEETKNYAYLFRQEHEICSIYDEYTQRMFRRHDINHLNGFICSDDAGMPYTYECTIGDGTRQEDGKLWPYSNVYKIEFWHGLDNVVIYKQLKRSLHEKEWHAGKLPKLFPDLRIGDSCELSHGVAIYEDLDFDEILDRLVNKSFKRFATVRHFKENYLFLDAMQKRLIKTLVDRRLIFYNTIYGKYYPISFLEMGLEKKENASFKIVLPG